MAKASRKKPERLAEKLLEIRQKLGLSQNGLIRRLGLTEELEQDYIFRISQKHVERWYQHSALELGDVVLLEFFGEPEAADHPVLGESQLEAYLQELFGEPLRLLT